VETSETEHWQNGKMETTAAKNIHCKINKLRKKQKFLASRLQRTGMTSSLKKLLTDCFKTLADSPKTGLLATFNIYIPDWPTTVSRKYAYDLAIMHAEVDWQVVGES